MTKTFIKTDRSISFALAGGGSHGAWEVGAISALMEHKQIRDLTRHVIGTSTGALIAAPLACYLATGDITVLNDLVNCYREVLDGNIMVPEDVLAYQKGGIKALLASSIVYGRDSLFSIAPLWETAAKVMTPERWQSLKKACDWTFMDVGFCCVNMQTGQPEVFWLSTRDIETCKKAMIASAAQPIIMDPVIIDGVQYCDGGLTDANPARHLFDKFASQDIGFRHTIIALTPHKSVPDPVEEQEFPKVLDQLQRVLSIFVGNMYQQNKAQVEAARLTAVGRQGHVIDVHWLEPRARIKFDALSFKQPAMSKLVDKGYADIVRTVTVHHAPATL